ncbi:MAG TPA: hypothetical protein VKD72_37495, partial [Gemmataceae bacterium]|nr:hypothetical protein [Gemmataceae bacterium]
AQDQVTQGQVQDQSGASEDTPRKLYATKAKAEADKPADASAAAGSNGATNRLTWRAPTPILNVL